MSSLVEGPGGGGRREEGGGTAVWPAPHKGRGLPAPLEGPRALPPPRHPPQRARWAAPLHLQVASLLAALFLAATCARPAVATTDAAESTAFQAVVSALSPGWQSPFPAVALGECRRAAR